MWVVQLLVTSGGVALVIGVGYREVGDWAVAAAVAGFAAGVHLGGASAMWFSARWRNRLTDAKKVRSSL